MEETTVSGGAVSSPAGAPRNAAGGAPPRAAAPRLSERLRQLRERAPAPGPGAAPPKTKLQSALDGAGLAPVYDEIGNFGGVRLSSIQPGGPFAGLPDNTICFEINGVKLDNAQALPSALVMTNASGEACLRCRHPDGQETIRCL